VTGFPMGTFRVCAVVNAGGSMAVIQSVAGHAGEPVREYPAIGGHQMQQFFNQLLQFLQQGIAAIFKFVQLIWTWSVSQIGALAQVPWQSWPLWKQVLLVLVIGAVAWALFKAAKELWDAAERILAAFAALLGVLVRTLPSVIVAGLIALGGVWVLNNVDLSSMRLPSFFQTSSVEGPTDRVPVDRR